MKYAIPMLGVLFVALKLTDHIDWSWLWVTAPFWGGLALAALAGLVWLIGWMTMGKQGRDNYRLRKLLGRYSRRLSR